MEQQRFIVVHQKMVELQIAPLSEDRDAIDIRRDFRGDRHASLLNLLRRISSPSTIIEQRRIPMRSIPVRWSLLGVVIAIVVHGGTGLVRAVRAGGAGHDHTVFSRSCRTCPVRPSRLLLSSTDPKAARQRTVTPAASSP